MSEHILKVQAPYFDAIKSGDKMFEVRRNDRGYQAGDTLILLDLGACACTSLNCDRRPTPIKRRVTFVYSGDPRFGPGGGLQPGYVVLGLGESPS